MKRTCKNTFIVKVDYMLVTSDKKNKLLTNEIR